MNEHYGVCESKINWLERNVNRFSRWSWWYTMPVASFIHKHTRYRLHPYPNHTKFKLWDIFLAGLTEACWTHVCGHGIRYSLRIGMIYWKPRKAAEDLQRILEGKEKAAGE